VAITSDGYDKWEGQTQEIKPGAQGALKADLNKTAAVAIKPPPHHGGETAERPGKIARILFWTSAVVTVGGAVAFSVTGSQVRSIEKEQDTAIANWKNNSPIPYPSTLTFPNDACKESAKDGNAKLTDICNRGKSMATMTNVLIGGTAAFAVATLFFAYKGYISPGEASPEKDSGVSVLPAVGPQGAGVTATIQF
jgi:hypothetical protein